MTTAQKGTMLALHQRRFALLVRLFFGSFFCMVSKSRMTPISVHKFFRFVFPGSAPGVGWEGSHAGDVTLSYESRRRNKRASAMNGAVVMRTKKLRGSYVVHRRALIARTLPLLACLCLLGCSQRDNTDPSNMTCVKRLQMPSRYPSLAQSARLSMDVTAAITVASDGKVQSVVYEGATDSRRANQNLFLPMIEQAIRASAFEPLCAHKTVRISYTFKMDAAPDVTASWFGYPNRVEVWAVSPLFNADETTPPRQ